MNNPLEETHVALSINIFDQTQHALVRKHLTVERLIGDVLREFALELDLNRKYILLQNGRQLDPELVIGDGVFDPENALVLGYYEPVRSVAQSENSMIIEGAPAPQQPVPTVQGALLELETGQEFRLNKASMILGRSSTANTEGIDIDLSVFREGRSVSRPHARVFVIGGKYYFEALKEDRPIYLNDKAMPFGEKHLLKPNDILGVGKVHLVFQMK